MLKFASVSEFHRHNTDDRKLRTPFCLLKFLCIPLQKCALREAATRKAMERYGLLFETYRCIANRCKTIRSAPAMQHTPVLVMHTNFISYQGLFVPRSFSTIFVISYTVTTISYPGHFVFALVISCIVGLGTR